MTDWAHQVCRDCPCGSSPAIVSRKDTEVAQYDTAIVVDWPTVSEVTKDEWFFGRRGSGAEMFKALLEGLGVDLEDVYICSALNCQPDPKKKAQHRKAMEACASRLRSELRAAGVEQALCIGPIGFGALTGATKLPAITKVRGKWHTVGGLNVLATLPPNFAIGEIGYFRDIASDVQKFIETDGPAEPDEVNVWVPESLTEAKEAFEVLMEQETIAMDLETYGFSPINHPILAAGFCYRVDGRSEVIILDEALMQKKAAWTLIRRLFNSPDHECVFHNAKFDIQFIRFGLESRGMKYDPHNIHDTMLLHYALDERPMGKFKSHNLEGLAAHRYDAPDYGIPMGKWLKEWAEAPELDKRRMRADLHEYLALDTHYTAKLFPDLWNECVEESEEIEEGKDLIDLYETLFMPGTLALGAMEYKGMLLDVEMFTKSSRKLEKMANQLLAKIQRTTGIADFNPSSPQQVKKYLYGELGLSREEAVANAMGEAISSEGIERGSSRGTFTGGDMGGETSSSNLRVLARGYPEHERLLLDIVEFRNIKKNAGTYINGLLDKADSDHRVRGSFNIHGTATGRLSSTNPNLQNVPPTSHTGIEVRSGFMAPDGYCLIEADYKQLEVRVAAELSQDEAMITMFKEGRDVHAEVSKAIYNKPPEEITSFMRMLGKIMLFGMLYGRSAKSVETGPEQEDIVMRGGERWNTQQVEEFFGNLLAQWPQYEEWREKLKKDVYANGQIVLPSGRRRRFEFIPRFDGGAVGRAGLNTPVQGTASDFTLYSLIQLHRVLPEGAEVISTVHDSILVECREDIALEVKELIRKTMEEDTLWKTEVPLRVDIDISKRWDEEDKRYGDAIAIATE